MALYARGSARSPCAVRFLLSPPAGRCELVGFTGSGSDSCAARSRTRLVRIPARLAIELGANKQTRQRKRPHLAGRRAPYDATRNCRHARALALPRPSQCAVHGAVHSAVSATVQGLIPRLTAFGSGHSPRGPAASFFTRGRHEHPARCMCGLSHHVLGCGLRHSGSGN